MRESERFAIGRFQALFDIEQADAARRILFRRFSGRHARPVIADRDRKLAVFHGRIKADRGRLARPADGKFHAVLEKGLQQQAGDRRRLRRLLDMHAGVQPLAKAHFLDAEREVERLKKFSSFQAMARWSLDLSMEYAKSQALATWLDSLADLLRDGEGDEKELYAEYQEELKRIEERYHE